MSIDHKTTVEPLVDNIYSIFLSDCIFSCIVVTVKTMKTTFMVILGDSTAFEENFVFCIVLIRLV